MYTPKEMKTIVANCNTIGDLTQVVSIFKRLFEDGAINTYYKFSLTLIIHRRLDAM